MFTESALIRNFMSLGIEGGDTVLIRAAIRPVGCINNGAKKVLNALLSTVGDEGTVVSLSFTGCSFINKPRHEDAFTRMTPTYAGALAQTMLEHPKSSRSKHPMCSYVAIGKNAEFITIDHGPESPAYEPIRKIMELRGKMILVGCVSSSPGFTTTHLAEYDLGLMNRIMFPWLNSVYYLDDQGQYQLFQRRDEGFCSKSFFKFYTYYVRAGILRAGVVGNAYSISVPAQEAYCIEKQILSKNPKFNICDNPYCFVCNAHRWDRVYMLPFYLIRILLRKFVNRKK
jgi:aminoglycoside N3'-acetyltransferase